MKILAKYRSIVTHHRPLLVILLLPGIIFYRWFFYSIFTYGDWGFHFSETTRAWFHLPYLWLTSGLGQTNLTLASWPIYFLYGVFGKLGLNSNIADKFLFFIPTAFLTAISSYILVKKITGSRLAAMIGVLVYSYNTYFLLNDTGILTLAASFALLPLVLFFFIKTLEEKSYYYGVITGLLGFIASFYEFRAFYIICFVLLLYYLFHVFIIERPSLKRFWQISLLAATPIVLIGLLDFYWLVAFLTTDNLVSNQFFERGLFGSGFMNVRESLALFHPFWTDGGPSLFQVQPIPAYFWLIPSAAFLGLVLNKKNRLILFFGGLAIVGVFLAKQDGAPFSHLYGWLYYHVPGFNAFRESSKFYALIALSYAILISSLVAWLENNWTSTRWQRIGRAIATALLGIIFLWNTTPLISGAIETLFIPRNIPTDYLKLKDFIRQQPDFFRTYWVPKDSRWGFYSDIHPKISGVDIIQTNWGNFTGSQQPIQQRVVDIFSRPDAAELFRSAAVKYIVVPIQDTDNNDDFYDDFGGNRNYFIDRLDKVPFLHKVDFNLDDLVVYENNKYSAHLASQGLRSTTISPTEYTLTLTGLKARQPLFFSEAFDSNWKLYLEPSSETVDKRRGRQKPIFDSSHGQAFGYANSWRIEPAYIKSHYPTSFYKQNPDGSIDVTMRLYFQPQTTLELGLLLSGLAFLMSIIYIIYYPVRNGENHVQT